MQEYIHRIISLYPKKTFVNFNHLFMIKVLERSWIQPKHNKSNMQQANIKLHGDKLKAISLSQEQDMLTTLTLSIQYITLSS